MFLAIKKESSVQLDEQREWENKDVVRAVGREMATGFVRFLQECIANFYFSIWIKIY